MPYYDALLLGYAPSGLTLDFIAYDKLGQVLNLASAWYETWGQYGSLADYRLAATEVAVGSGRYKLDTTALGISQVLVNAIYSYELRKRGATLADSTVIWTDVIAQDVMIEKLDTINNMLSPEINDIINNTNTIISAVSANRTILAVSGSTVQMLHTAGGSNYTCYYTIMNDAGQIFNGTTAEAINYANWSSYKRLLSQPTVTGGSTNLQLRKATFPALAAGMYFIVGYKGGFIPASTDAPVAMIAVAWDGTTLTITRLIDTDIARIWNAAVAGLTTAGTIGKKLADIDFTLMATISAQVSALQASIISTGITVTVSSALAPDGVLTLVPGDDYLNDNGRAIIVSTTGLPTFVGSTPHFHIGPYLITGTVMDDTTLRFDLTAAQTANLKKSGTYQMFVTLVDSHVVTVQIGTYSVRQIP